MDYDMQDPPRFPKPLGCLFWIAIVSMPICIFATGFLFGRYL